MSLKRVAAARKMPSQDRSSATVDAMITATAHILATEGYDRASTNRIAAAAGVSIGSLYQYFPNKDSLIAALVERHATQMLGQFESELASLSGMALEDAIPELIRASVQTHGSQARLHRVLTRELPRGLTHRLEGATGIGAAMIRERLEGIRSEIRPKNLDLAVFIIVSAVSAVIHARVIEPPEKVDDEQLVRELSDLVLRYLIKIGEHRH